MITAPFKPPIMQTAPEVSLSPEMEQTKPANPFPRRTIVHCKDCDPPGYLHDDEEKHFDESEAHWQMERLEAEVPPNFTGDSVAAALSCARVLLNRNEVDKAIGASLKRNTVQVPPRESSETPSSAPRLSPAGRNERGNPRAEEQESSAHVAASAIASTRILRSTPVTASDAARRRRF